MLFEILNINQNYFLTGESKEWTIYFHLIFTSNLTTFSNFEGFINKVFLEKHILLFEFEFNYYEASATLERAKDISQEMLCFLGKRGHFVNHIGCILNSQSRLLTSQRQSRSTGACI